MRFKRYITVNSPEEALEILNEDENSVILGGNTFLRLSATAYSTAVDLSKLGLKYIKETNGSIEIGAYASLRDIEVDKTIPKHFSSFLADTVRHIVGVQFRNCATVGGAVCGKYGFSELLTTLSVLECNLEFCKAGIIPLRDFISGEKISGDFLRSVHIRINGGRYSYKAHRNSDADFPVIAVAASFEDKLRMAVGARPGIAELSTEGVQHIPVDMKKGINLLQEEFTFGSDIRAGADYRKTICGVLAERCAAEVLR